MKNKWQETEFNQLYYRENDGLVIGLAHRLGTQGVVYLSKIYKDNIEQVLGQYVSMTFAKQAIEHYWEINSKAILEYENI